MFIVRVIFFICIITRLFSFLFVFILKFFFSSFGFVVGFLLFFSLLSFVSGFVFSSGLKGGRVTSGYRGFGFTCFW